MIDGEILLVRSVHLVDDVLIVITGLELVDEEFGQMTGSGHLYIT